MAARELRQRHWLRLRQCPRDRRLILSLWSTRTVHALRFRYRQDGDVGTARETRELRHVPPVMVKKRIPVCNWKTFGCSRTSLARFIDSVTGALLLLLGSLGWTRTGRIPEERRRIRRSSRRWLVALAVMLMLLLTLAYYVEMNHEL